MTKNNNGFTLIEMSVIILITAVMIAMAIGFAISIISTARQIETNHKLKLVKEALAEYAVMNNRIPCPSSALRTGNANYGFENGNGTALGVSGYRCNANQGAVPFRTLGISENLTIDGWGNPISYAVSPAFTLSTVEAQTSVHINCRTREWFYANGRPIDIISTPAVIDVAPMNPEKAAFCCAGNVIGNNLIVQDQAGINIIDNVRTSSAAADLARAATIFQSNMIDPTQYPPRNWNPNGIVYALVSHGENGFRAYDLESGNRVAAAASACEIENGDDDLNYRDCEQNDNIGAPAFNDDITVWATQDEMFASQNESCAVP